MTECVSNNKSRVNQYGFRDAEHDLRMLPFTGVGGRNRGGRRAEHTGQSRDRLEMAKLTKGGIAASERVKRAKFSTDHNTDRQRRVKLDSRNP